MYVDRRTEVEMSEIEKSKQVFVAVGVIYAATWLLTGAGFVSRQTRSFIQVFRHLFVVIILFVLARFRLNELSELAISLDSGNNDSTVLGGVSYLNFIERQYELQNASIF